MKNRLDIIKNTDNRISIIWEDALFEEIINYPTALYAQMLWDSNRKLEDIMHETALMPDVEII